MWYMELYEEVWKNYCLLFCVGIIYDEKNSPLAIKYHVFTKMYGKSKISNPRDKHVSIETKKG